MVDCWCACQFYLSAEKKKKHIEESRLMGGTALGLAPMFCLPVKCIGPSIPPHISLVSSVSVNGSILRSTHLLLEETSQVRQGPFQWVNCLGCTLWVTYYYF